MGDVEIEKLLEPHASDLETLAEAAANGQRDKVIEGAASLAVTLATGNPLIGALAPFATKGIAKAFGNATNAAIERELAKLSKEAERREFLSHIGALVEVSIGQALIQLVRVNHNIKDELLAALGGLHRDFDAFRADFERLVRDSGQAVIVDKMLVRDGAIGIRVRASATSSVRLRHQVVAGRGSVGIELE